MAARDIYLFALVIIGLVILAAGVADFLLWMSSQETISQFLRKNMGWYWGVSYAAALFLIVLGLHLYFPFPGE